MASLITRVWGRADAFDIEFTQRLDGKWYVNIPPDLTDGQYAVEIYVQNIYGERAYWTGILYMHNGRACLHLSKTSCTLWLRPSMCSLNFIHRKTELKLERVCACGKSYI
ncbi:MAG: Ig-like domain-containing protein [Clostridia bacterium]|nr:Ig-like domain-containing protein [Clostridia bacterium]